MIDEQVLGRMSNAGFVMHHDRLPGTKSFIESFRPNQIACKKWLVEEITNTQMSWDNVLVLGSWNSCLLYELMSHYGSVGHYTFVDIDDDVHLHRDVYFDCNKLHRNYTSINSPVESISDFGDYDLIINTSCEHMPPTPAVHGPTYALQSNDYNQLEEHTHCVKSPDELKKQYGLIHELYKGTKKMPNYNRFMVIGYYW
jgi:hypothetical protein